MDLALDHPPGPDPDRRRDGSGLDRARQRELEREALEQVAVSRLRRDDVDGEDLDAIPEQPRADPLWPIRRGPNRLAPSFREPPPPYSQGPRSPAPLP